MFVPDSFDEMSQWRLMIFFHGDGRGDHSMRAVTEYGQRARECRELARMVHKLEDKYALDCAAQSWDRLAERREGDIEAEY